MENGEITKGMLYGSGLWIIVLMVIFSVIS
jgi:hypothetical protein